MKFGKTFLSHQIPEWSIFYINYKQLKKIIKGIDDVVSYNDYDSAQVPSIVSNITSLFFFELDRDIERVDEFYNNKFQEYDRRLSNIKITLGIDKDLSLKHSIESIDELEEIISIIIELRNVYRNLKWYGDLNHKGIVKILKKLDKKLLHLQETVNGQLDDDAQENLISLPLSNRENYLNTRIEALPFANLVEISQGLETINSILNELSHVREENKLRSTLDHLSQISLDISDVVITRSSNDKTLYSSSAESFKLMKSNPSFDNVTLKALYTIIENDEDKNLMNELRSMDSSRLTDKFIGSLLVRACVYNCLACIDSLIEFFFQLNTGVDSNLDSPLQSTDISGRNIFHQLISHWGKSSTSNDPIQKIIPGESVEVSRKYRNKSGTDGAELDTLGIEGFKFLLERLHDQPFEIKKLLLGKDNYLRTPLHYSAQYGLKEITMIILEHLEKWGLLNEANSIDDINVWGDQEGLTPIHLAIIGHHPATTGNLLKYSKTQKLKMQGLLLLAVRLNDIEILGPLLEIGKIDINYTDLEHNNETALYIAAKLNYVKVTSYLLQNGANTELREDVFGWTPLFVAACEGYRDIVELLIQNAARFDLADESGWLPIEHACLRGHLELAEILKPPNQDLLLYDIYSPLKNIPRESYSSLKSKSPNLKHTADEHLSNMSIYKLPESNMKSTNDILKQVKSFDSNTLSSKSKVENKVKKFSPIKSFGHRYLAANESLLMITLGTTDLRDNHKPIELNEISVTKSYLTEFDTALSLCITCRDKRDFQNGLVEPPVIVDLPLEDHHGSASDPITFKLSGSLSPDDIIITFDIVPTYQYSNFVYLDSGKPKVRERKILGRAVAVLNTAYTKVGPNLRSLNSIITAPILETGSLDMIGKVRFEYLCAKAFSHSSMPLCPTDTYWKKLVSTRIIGHRGLGKNMKKSSLQLGENTVESFIAAASLGASYVEFDVQLTKDFTPVVYHDFTVAESGVDIPMHVLTEEQFLGLGDIIPVESAEDSKYNTNKSISVDGMSFTTRTRPRSLSSSSSVSTCKYYGSMNNTKEYSNSEHDDYANNRMKLTKTWKDNGYKGNARGLNIASKFVTLKELFKKLPNTVGFNIELKYPMLSEAESESMGEIAIDLNFYVDTILKVVYDENTTGRDILFSSFHPDVCLLLSLKQPSIPILFLTEAGTHPMSDIRASSLQHAIRFAKKWNLLGLVSAAKALLEAPRLVQAVKASGLVCVTYGVENNSPDLAQIQMSAGVDAVIADSVLAVREGLREEIKQRI